jgi:hypothetical protein
MCYLLPAVAGFFSFPGAARTRAPFAASLGSSAGLANEHMRAACSSCSPLLACTRGPAHDSPLPSLLAVHAHSHHAARVTPRPLLLAVPLHACYPCTPSRRATRCCGGPSLTRPLALAACALYPSIPAAINSEVPVLPVTLPCWPSPLSLSAYKSAPEPPLTPPMPPQHLPSSTSRCSSPPPRTIAGHHPSPWTALRRPSPHEVKPGIGPPWPPLHFPLLPGVAMHQGIGAHGLAAPHPTVPLPHLFCLEEEERQTCA